ncbi:MAG: iron-sulfur cluster assembly scaffold protein [Maritimibacter harenae]|jgi:NifU-like protein involved in Fe-S cluster formation|uniref:Iron-sulfur cluster assembly scaffold protein n=1 Tax=Maritimibacter harenae TaxID=2606218 RepID=A0A845LZS6_9RHOB|nr:iron-sulfur cluster assembly scaffold protein [Maritimibacter harenae]MZR13295.1 iron-sulfur cluster assembly scaffold protein [Maritimibacter harenae]
MSDADLIKLYSKRILALAADIPHHGRLEAPQGTSKKRSPLCGSTVTADVRMENGRIADFAQNVKACALGQASSAILGAHVLGQDRASIQAARDALVTMLKEDGPTPPAPFDDLEVLRPAREFKNRHPSILLAWDATLAAMDEAQEAA